MRSTRHAVLFVWVFAGVLATLALADPASVLASGSSIGSISTISTSSSPTSERLRVGFDEEWIAVVAFPEYETSGERVLLMPNAPRCRGVGTKAYGRKYPSGKRALLYWRWKCSAQSAVSTGPPYKNPAGAWVTERTCINTPLSWTVRLGPPQGREGRPAWVRAFNLTFASTIVEQRC